MAEEEDQVRNFCKEEIEDDDKLQASKANLADEKQDLVYNEVCVRVFGGLTWNSKSVFVFSQKVLSRLLLARHSIIGCRRPTAILHAHHCQATHTVRINDILRFNFHNFCSYS